ncbi:hypothetical protein PQ690_02700 [Thermoanaerobacterium thermosaccharolyticum]|jgi:hypothetical protein
MSNFEFISGSRELLDLVQPLNGDIELPLKWNDGNNTSIESAINHVLNSLTIPNEYMPDFKSKYKYYLKKKEDFSVIYLVFVPDKKRLYVIENIF